MRTALFITCLADALFPDVGKATVRVLERLGQEVEFPTGQTCCGQMHVNTGYQKQALPLVERFAEVLHRTTPSWRHRVPVWAQCVTSMR